MDRMIPRTLDWETDSLIPEISMVPPKRRELPIGVTATLASVRIEQMFGVGGGLERDAVALPGLHRQIQL